MERTIPYFKDVIVPQSINKGKSVLIASSENAIRGLLMHLCDIPIDRIHQVLTLAVRHLSFQTNLQDLMLLPVMKTYYLFILLPHYLPPSLSG